MASDLPASKAGSPILALNRNNLQISDNKYENLLIFAAFKTKSYVSYPFEEKESQGQGKICPQKNRP